MKKEQFSLLLQVAFPLAYFLLSYDLPFWGDSIASVSKAAIRIYDEGLQHPWNYTDADPGHPTLFPWLIALGWKIFGYALWVPHALMALTLFACARLMYLLASPLSEEWKSALLLLLFVSPLTISQGVSISLQLPLTAFFLAAFYNWRKKYFGWFMFYASCMVLTHLQGVLLLATLSFFEVWKQKFNIPNLVKSAVYFFVPVGAFVIWCFVHYLEFGWAYITPNFPREEPGLDSMIYNLALMGWRYLDLGYFFIGIPAFWFAVKKVWKGSDGDSEKIFLLSILVLCIGISILFIDPPSHRYILPVYFYMALLFVKQLQSWSRTKQTMAFSAAVLLLLSGSIWHYPGKCLGDQNLVFLNYHSLEKEVEDLLPEGTVVYSFAPLNNNGPETYLEERHLIHRDLYGAQLDTVPFILQSNVTCEFARIDMDSLPLHFSVHSFERWGVYLNLWVNQNQWEQFPELKENHAREPGAVEEFIARLKKEIKPTP